MAKLVLLSAGMSGRSHELKVDKTTIGRVEDNTFQLTEPSVSSHHCELILQGSEVVVRDLNSTNGTFINGERITTDSILKPGQTLRLGHIEMRLETEGMASQPLPAQTAPPAPAPPSAPATQTRKSETGIGVSRGVKLDELDPTTRKVQFDPTSKGFSKKDNKANKIFWIVAGAVGVVIVCLLLYVFVIAGKN